MKINYEICKNRQMIKIAIVESKFQLLFQSVDGEYFLNQIKLYDDNQQPDIVLMDLEMPNIDGVSTIGTASALYPQIKFVVLTIFDDDDKIFRAIKAGACGYLLKEESGKVINEMLLNLWDSGAGPISPSIAYKILQMMQQPVQKPANDLEKVFQLSEREKEILQLLSQGLEYKEIGLKTNISPNTVKKHCISIYQKLHVNSKAKALRIAYTKGLI